jgi:CubicO group peptidase (beta-lactamase class C family)
LCANVDDLLRYTLAQLNHGELDGARILPASAYDEMWSLQPTHQSSIGMNGVDYGLGWAVYTIGGHRIVGHGGGEISYNTSVYFAPDDGIGVVMLGNEKLSCEIENAAYRVMAMMFGVQVDQVSCCG